MESQIRGWESTSSITFSCLSSSLFSFTPLLLSHDTAPTLFPSDHSSLSSPAPPKRPPITSATSALRGLLSGTPLPTSSASASLHSLSLSSHSGSDLLRLLTRVPFPLFDLGNSFLLFFFFFPVFICVFIMVNCFSLQTLLLLFFSSICNSFSNIYDLFLLSSLPLSHSIANSFH